jgi:hypothetical protein
MEPRTTIDYKGVTYPFYVTNRGRFEFENAGFNNAEIAKGSFAAQLALVYYNLKDCAKRANLPFTDSFEQFIDNTDTDVINVFLRLQEVKEKAAGNPKPGRKTPV